MASAGTVQVAFQAKGLGKFQADAKNAAKSTTALGMSAQKAKAGLAALAKATAVLSGVAIGMGLGMKKLADSAGSFEYELARAGAITRATAKDMKILEDAAIAAGIATQFSPEEAAQGLSVLGAMGMQAAQATAILPAALDLAAAGMISVQDAASSVVGMLRVYGKGINEASEVTDKLVRITSMSGYQASEFAVSLGKAASKTAGSNQTLETTLITMGLMRNTFTDAASAGTYYSRAVTNMTSSERARNAMQKLGVDFYEKGTRKSRQFLDVTVDLTKKLKGYTDEAKDKYITDIFGARAKGIYTAVSKAQITVEKEGRKVTLKGAAAIKQYYEELEHASGAAKEFRERLLDTYEGQKTLLKGTMATLAIVTGQPITAMFKPIIASIVDGLNEVINVVKRVPEGTKKLAAAATMGIAGLAALAAVVLGSITAVGAAIVLIGPMIKAGFAAVPAIFTAIASALGTLMTVIAPVLIIIGTIALVVGMVYETNERTLGALANIWRSFADYIRGIISAVTGFISRAWEGVMQAIFSSTKTAFDSTIRVMNTATNILMGIIGGLVETYGQLLFALGQEEEAAALRGLQKQLQNFDADWAANLTLMKKEWIEPSIRQLGYWGDALDATTKAIMDDFGSAISGGFEMGITGLQKMLGPALGGLMDELALALPDIPTLLPPGGKGGGGGGGQGLPGAGPKKYEGAKEDFGGYANALDQARGEQEKRQVGGVQAIGGAMQGNVGAMVSGIATAAGAAFGPLGSAIVGVADGLIGMSREGAKFKQELAAVFQTLAQALNPVFKALRPLLEVFQPIAKLAGVIVEVVFAFSLMQPMIWLVGKQLTAVGIVIAGIIIAFRWAWIAILEMVNYFVDYSHEIAQLQAAQATAVRERNEMIERFTGEATADEQRARRERELAEATNAATSAMLNVPSGYKIARARFGAETPVMDDFVMRPGQPPVQFSPDDTIVGAKSGVGGGTTIVIENLELRANDPASFFNKLVQMVNTDNLRGGLALGGAYQGRP